MALLQGKNLLLDYKKQKSSYKSCKSCKLNNKGGRQSWRAAAVCKTVPYGVSGFESHPAY